jgi:cytochrome c oxidase subunit II
MSASSCGVLAPLQSAIDPAGPQAARIYALDRGFIVISVVVFVLVMSALAYVLLRRRSPTEVASAPLHHDRAHEARLTRIVAGATATTVIALVVLLVMSVRTGKALNFGDRPDALDITINAHRWWWEVTYSDATPSMQVNGSNELHLPVGRPVELHLKSADVVHSLWIPNLHGKTDLIPGRENVTMLQVDRAGEYRAQCAEFCGVQHAHMAMVVIAEPEEDFQKWLAAQRTPPPAPTGEAEKKGLDVFLRGTCATCHSIAGTPAQAIVGPDLSHLASRKTIGAGTLLNGPGALAGWVIDPQGIKPGVQMPSHALRTEDLDPLLAYLETLK